MAKKAADKVVTEIKGLLKEKKLVIGTEMTLKKILLGKIERVFLSSNCPENVRGDIDYYSKINKFNVSELKYPNDELGSICKKPFSISVLGVLKGEN